MINLIDDILKSNMFKEGVIWRFNNGKLNFHVVISFFLAKEVKHDGKSLNTYKKQSLSIGLKDPPSDDKVKNFKWEL